MSPSDENGLTKGHRVSSWGILTVLIQSSCLQTTGLGLPVYKMAMPGQFPHLPGAFGSAFAEAVLPLFSAVQSSGGAPGSLPPWAHSVFPFVPRDPLAGADPLSFVCSRKHLAFTLGQGSAASWRRDTKQTRAWVWGPDSLGSNPTNPFSSLR